MGGHHGGHHGHHRPPPGFMDPDALPPLRQVDPFGTGHMSPCMYVSVQWMDHERDQFSEPVMLHKDRDTAQLFPQVS